MEDKILEKELLADTIFELFQKDESEAIHLLRQSNHIIFNKRKDIPQIDIVCCVYNGEEFIINSMECILNQSHQNFNLIIVTDPCTDNTLGILNEYKEKYNNIFIIENKTHLGIISSLNVGLSFCKNEYIARMDLDDLIHPLRFEKQLNYLLQHEEISVVSSFMKIINEKKEIINVKYKEDFDLQKITLLFYSPISHAASFFKSDVLKKLGYRENYKYAEDYDLWFRVMSNYKTAVMPDYLYLYRTHSNQTTNSKNVSKIIEAWKLIISNVFSVFNLQFNEKEISTYINHCMLDKKLSDPKAFILINNILSKLYQSNLNAKYFHVSKLRQFIFTNFWQNYFSNTYKELNRREFYELLRSPYNLYSKTENIKYRIKAILKMQ